MLRRLFMFTACSLFLNVSIHAADPKPLTLTTRVTVGSAPADFLFKIRIEPNIANRAWCLEFDGPRYFRGSCLEIVNGEKEAVFRQVWVKGAPGGNYEVRAWVCRSRDCKEREITKLRVKVTGSLEDGPEPDAEAFDDADPGIVVGLAGR